MRQSTPGSIPAGMMREVLRPSALILLGVNLVPLLGVIAWRWDAFVLLMLYWLETAVIAFWTVVRVAAMTPGELGDFKLGGARGTTSPPAMALFLCAHAGIFMGVHLMFLWSLFAGDWTRRIHGVGTFVDQMVMATGLWLPLLALFAGRGALVLFDLVQPAMWTRLGLAAPPPGTTVLGTSEQIVLGLYLRITVMQLTILLGAWFALVVGTAGALAFLILVKTAVDLGFHLLAEHIRAAVRRAQP